MWKILDTAERLFIQKGYEKTSLQDIIRETDLSKGAIYHHFTSKEEIFYSVCERIGQRNAEVLSSVRDDPSLNGLEKLRRIFKVSLQPERQAKMFSMMPYLLDNAKFLTAENPLRKSCRNLCNRFSARASRTAPSTRTTPRKWRRL